MRIAYLVFNLDGMGGTSRSAVTQANALAGDHDVRLVSVTRSADAPHYDIDPRVTVDYLYHLSAAHYLTVADLLGLDVETFTLVYVGKDAPHYVSVTDLASDLIDEGRDLRTLALDRIAGRVEPYEGATGRITLHAYGHTPAAVEPTIPADFEWSPND